MISRGQGGGLFRYLFGIVGIFWCTVLSGQVHAVTWYISPEQSDRAGTGSVAQQEVQAQQLVDTQDDVWYATINSTDSVIRSLFGSGADLSLGITPYQLVNTGGTVAELYRVQMDGPVLGTPNGTATQPKLDDAITLQDTAPFPASLTGERFWNESVGGSSNARNAVRFDVLTGVTAFGAWFGDLETRTDGQGTSAEVQLFDSIGTMIASQIIAPTTGNQASCGGGDPTTSPSACGNETTRWVGFTLAPTEQVSTILVIVGDDDDPNDAGTNDGNTEHISLIGPTFVIPCQDADSDGICNSDDVCPDDPEKIENIGCGCGVTDPDILGEACTSDANSCGAVGTGTIQCDGTCDAVSLDLPSRYNEVCTSEANACGEVGTGVIDCAGDCYAFVPDLPEGYGDACTSEQNTCGEVGTGTIQCDTSCDALIPDESLCPVEEEETDEEEEEEIEEEEEETEEEEEETEEEEEEIEEDDEIKNTDPSKDTTDEEQSVSSRGSGGSTSRNYVSYCGNGIVDADEECDDGNYIDADGCSKTCLIHLHSTQTTQDETVILSKKTPEVILNTSLSVIDILDDMVDTTVVFTGLLDTGAGGEVLPMLVRSLMPDAEYLGDSIQDLQLPAKLPETGSFGYQ